jgi:hypothetical protein
MTRARCFLMICLALAAGAGAQPKIATRIEVLLKCSSNQPPAISIVLNNDEADTYPLEKKDGLYTIDLRNNPLDARGLTGSVRIGGKRSGCVTAEPRWERNAYTAVFRFHCIMEEAWPLDVEPLPGMQVSYVRRLPASKSLQTIDCSERGSLINGTIEDIAPVSETIEMMIGRYPLRIVDGIFAGRSLAAAGKPFTREQLARSYRPTADDSADIARKLLPAGFKQLRLEKRK